MSKLYAGVQIRESLLKFNRDIHNNNVGEFPQEALMDLLIQFPEATTTILSLLTIMINTDDDTYLPREWKNYLTTFKIQTDLDIIIKKINCINFFIYSSSLNTLEQKQLLVLLNKIYNLLQPVF
ncbi:hypothetical protein CCFV1_ORF090 [Cotesia congregata filamentous virus 1]|uniref:Uncharacterized protein n=1 Tax=Cotesia congregata filamentous virus 1 TaxID=3064291 RepID=A0ABC8QR77_9VIRU|nr:hypothetical protein CCFV1_ORF090 [Cotesia congregata filamentous virus 1]